MLLSYIICKWGSPEPRNVKHFRWKIINYEETASIIQLQTMEIASYVSCSFERKVIVVVELLNWKYV